MPFHEETEMIVLAIFLAAMGVAIITAALVVVRWFVKNDLWRLRTHQIITYLCFPMLILLLGTIALCSPEQALISYCALAGFLIFWAFDSCAWKLTDKQKGVHAARMASGLKLIRRAEKVCHDEEAKNAH